MVSMVTREMIDDTGHGSTIFNMMVVTIAKIIQKKSSGMGPSALFSGFYPCMVRVLGEAMTETSLEISMTSRATSKAVD